MSAKFFDSMLQSQRYGLDSVSASYSKEAAMTRDRHSQNSQFSAIPPSVGTVMRVSVC